MRPLLRTLALVVLAAASAAQQPPSLDDLRLLVGVSSVQIAPDGKTVAFVTSRANFADNENEAQLCTVDVATGAVRELTQGRKRVSQPSWSPDGNTLAFVAPDAQKEPQVWLLPLRGGEARRLTNSPTGVEHYSWRPDGLAIAFAAEDEAPKREGEERHVGTFRIGDQDLFLKEAVRSRHVWTQALADEQAKRITSGVWSLEFVLPPSSPASTLAWSPDGKRIALTQVPAPQSGKLDLGRILLLDVESGATQVLNSVERYQSAPTFTPDGSAVLYRYPRDGKPEFLSDYYLASAADGPGRNVTRELDRHVFGTEWMPNGKEFLTACNERDTVGLWVVPIDPSAGKPRALDLDGLVVSGAFGYDVTVAATGAIAFSATRADRPAEVYVMSSATAKPKQLTKLNAWADERRFARMERVTWKTHDGFDADGVIALPADLSTPRPLVLVIHGGPTSASKTSFSMLPQLMAAKGWVVFSPNYRGSDNLGHAYANAIFDDAGEGPGRDVMAGVAELKKRAYVDSKRVFVTGWSYGGFMTTWLLGKYPSEWTAGVAGAAVTDWTDMYNFADGNVGIRHAFGGSPWKREFADAYRAQSPITYATNIRAPTLILTNLEDYRVPPTQSFALYHALKDNGVETEFIGFQGRTHSSSDPVNARERTKLWMGWIESHLDAPRATPAASGAASGAK
ncbi:MAG: S9 family peptidase [Planctomycetes bacterium]|nr:S9 family peptidase [Planctomycetota bacterium]